MTRRCSMETDGCSNLAPNCVHLGEHECRAPHFEHTCPQDRPGTSPIQCRKLAITIDTTRTDEKYIVIIKHNADCGADPYPHVIDRKELRVWLNDGSINLEDEVYLVTEQCLVREARHLTISTQADGVIAEHTEVY